MNVLFILLSTIICFHVIWFSMKIYEQTCVSQFKGNIYVPFSSVFGLLQLRSQILGSLVTKGSSFFTS